MILASTAVDGYFLIDNYGQHIYRYYDGAVQYLCLYTGCWHQSSCVTSKAQLARESLCNVSEDVVSRYESQVRKLQDRVFRKETRLRRYLAEEEGLKCS